MLVKKKHRELIAPTEDRIQNIKDYLRTVRQDIEFCVVPMADAFGPTITEEKIQALVVSVETLAGGKAGMHSQL
jgi:pantetheine-phosphate adenylyltransferase